MQVHQFHPTVSYGDAISNQILSLQNLLRRMGFESEVFCERLPTHFEGRARHIGRYDHFSSPGSIILLHFSLGYSREVIAWLSGLPDQKVIVYHNITPHRYFTGINDVYFEAAKKGREQLGRLGTLVDAGWGVSAFNCQELIECGWTNVGVLPIIFDPNRYAARPHRGVLRRWQGGFNVLFVGRISPNKCLEDLILTFYHLKRYVRTDARLLLVGSAKGMEVYLEFLRTLVKSLGLSEVKFAGHVSNEELIAFYQCADVYLSMSEHEGFGVPLLESMHFGLPVIAYKAAAVPETLDGSGILVNQKNHEAVAELIGVVAEDEVLLSRIVSRQRARLAEFLPDAVQDRLRILLRDLKTGK